MRDRLAAGEDTLSKLRILIGEHLALVERDASLAAVLSVELRQSSKFVRDYKAHKFYEYMGLIEDLFDQGAREGCFRFDLHPKLYRRAIFGALDEIVSFWVTLERQGQEPPCSLVTAADQVFKLFVSGLHNGECEQTDRSIC
jgi:TetR/AcrR family fatty acid metabolism transcriptional regulator